MDLQHKTALVTATLLVLLGAGSIMFGPKRGGEVPAAPAVEARALIVPIAGVALGDLVDSWGAPRSGGRHHEGVDIMAAGGTPVRAAAAGRIVKLFQSKLGGTTVYQADASGALILYYAHLRAYAPGLAAGHNVSQGQVIGYVGMTGNATTPHLHFEVHVANLQRQWWKGRAVNPYLALKAGRVDSVQTAAVGR